MGGTGSINSRLTLQITDFTHVARDVTRKRSEKFIVIKIVNAHAKLQERLNFVLAFRTQHEQLHSTIVKVSRHDSGGGTTAVQDVVEAYDSVKATVNVLDISSEGNDIWTSAEKSYNDRVSRVENQIIATLRDRLGAAKNANEMFRVFGKFNSLFIRPKIRGAIQEYQNQLVLPSTDSPD